MPVLQSRSSCKEILSLREAWTETKLIWSWTIFGPHRLEKMRVAVRLFLRLAILGPPNHQQGMLA